MSLAVHNVSHLSDEEVCGRFVVRYHELEELVSHLNDDDPPRHALIVGQRGMGKSLLLRRLAITVRRDAELAARWLPLLMPEELYQVTSIGEFWLAALDRLAADLDDADLAQHCRALQAERDPGRLATLALQRLLSAAQERRLRLLLLAENLDMVLETQLSPQEGWSLRQALQTESDLLLIGTAATTSSGASGSSAEPERRSSSRLASVEEAGEAFYGFFHRVDLRPLDDDEVRGLWRALTNVDLTGARAVPIRILTGGNPRLITVLARFSRQPDLSDLRHDLERLIDDYTPYLRANIDVLPVTERKVFIALADIWAPATAAELAERTRMTSSQVSALLGRLVRRDAVQVADQEPGRQRYELTDRLYNLYHLLRTPDGSGRVRALVDILLRLFEPSQLERAIFPRLVRAGTQDASSPLETLIASRLERHLEQAGVWDSMLPDELGDRLPVLNELLASQRTALGDEHADTFATRQMIAFVVGHAGDWPGALALYREVLRDQESSCGPGHADTLASRAGVARCTGEAGDPQRALDLFSQLVVDSERSLGPDHPQTLSFRHQRAHYTGASGNPRSALHLYRQIAADRERVLGPDHPHTLTSRRQVAHYTGVTGDRPAALALYSEIAADQERILGPDGSDAVAAPRFPAGLTAEEPNTGEDIDLDWRARRAWSSVLPIDVTYAAGEGEFLAVIGEADTDEIEIVEPLPGLQLVFHSAVLGRLAMISMRSPLPAADAAWERCASTLLGPTLWQVHQDRARSGLPPDAPTHQERIVMASDEWSMLRHVVWPALHHSVRPGLAALPVLAPHVPVLPRSIVVQVFLPAGAPTQPAEQCPGANVLLPKSLARLHGLGTIGYLAPVEGPVLVVRFHRDGTPSPVTLYLGSSPEIQAAGEVRGDEVVATFALAHELAGTITLCFEWPSGAG